MKYQTVSIIIPVYNEEGSIGEILEKVVRADTLGLSKEVIIVDDGSTDGTLKNVKAQMLKRKSTAQKLKFEFKLIAKKQNQGKGRALRDGFVASTGDIVLVQDADLEYSPAAYPALLEPFFKDNVDVVYGSRFMSERPHRVLYFWHFLGNQAITLLSNMVTNLNFTDIYCGYKIFRGDLIREIAPTLTSSGFEIEAELTRKISHFKNLKIYEVGVSYFGRTFEEGKKIRPWDIVPGVLKILLS